MQFGIRGANHGGLQSCSIGNTNSDNSAYFEATAIISNCRKQVRSDNDASEMVILGQFGGHLDEFGTLGEVGEVFK